LAKEILQGQLQILLECIDLCSYEPGLKTQKHIRSGAAKVVEIVAEKQPDWVAPHLEKLLPALAVEEPQTRWMVIRTMGFCAHLNKAAAQNAIVYAEKYLINKKDGLCLASSADLFLGDFGAVSIEDAQKVFPILELSMDNLILNEQDWILEALYKIFPNLGKEEKGAALKFAEHWQYATRKSTQERARKILRIRR
jgi:hypothetical protein